MTERHIAVIGDLVGSRRAGDRSRVQADLLDALALVNAHVEAEQALAATIGDEFQGVYRSVGQALRACLLIRLALPSPLDARCGLGSGEIEIVGTSAYGLTQDGPAWWSARRAITEAKSREVSRNKSLRTWLVDQAAVADEQAINAGLLARDHIVTAMSPRERRLACGHVLGQTQAALAQAEGITQGAVSQSLNKSGAYALSSGLALLE
jgi:hypothetical protein